MRNIEKNLLPYCEKNNIVIIANRPLASGAITKYHGDTKKIFDEISKKHGGKTIAQIAINWLLSKNNLVFPIPRASNPSRVLENEGSLGWGLDSEDIELLETCCHS
jgi:diketogulonate reductase-like aldo/keto reductase